MQSALKTLVKKLPAANALHSKIVQRLTAGSLANNEILRGFIDENGWLFTQPKTGTNLIASAIAFYNAELLGLKDYTFDDRYRLGMVHGGHIIRGAEGIRDALKFQKLSTRMLITRWHDDVPHARPSLLICTTRNLLDQLSSLWHYKYRALGISVDDSISDMLNIFVKRNRDQARAMQRAERSLVVHYENLTADPKAELIRILKAAYGAVDEEALATALRRSSRDEFKKWEQTRGAPAIGEKLKNFERSFIRSGKVGEGAEFFSDHQRSQIETLAARGNVPMNGDITALPPSS